MSPVPQRRPGEGWVEVCVGDMGATWERRGGGKRKKVPRGLQDMMAYEDVWEKKRLARAAFWKSPLTARGRIYWKEDSGGQREVGRGSRCWDEAARGLARMGSWKAQRWFGGVLLLDPLSAGSVSTA